MTILLTNDDGIHAPALRRLREELRDLGRVVIVAPDRDQSATSHSLTLHRPFRIRQHEADIYSVDGTPTDCVVTAYYGLLDARPDVVVSGINHGPNMGEDVFYSGTVAAAIEGAFFRCTSVACSLEYTRLKPLDFARGAELARRVVEQIVARRPPAGSLFNVNIPALERGPVRGIRVVPQNVAPYVEAFDRRIDPRGRVYFWTTPNFGCPDPHPDTDVTALAEGYITVTPLQFDLTHAERLRQMSAWRWVW